MLIYKIQMKNYKIQMGNYKIQMENYKIQMENYTKSKWGILRYGLWIMDNAVVL